MFQAANNLNSILPTIFNILFIIGIGALLFFIGKKIFRSITKKQ